VGKAKQQSDAASLQPGHQEALPKQEAAPVTSEEPPKHEGNKLKAAALGAAAIGYMQSGAKATLETRLEPLRVVPPPGVVAPINTEECYANFARMSMCPGGSDAVKDRLECTEQESAGDSQFASIYMLLRGFGGGASQWNAFFNAKTSNRADIIVQDVVWNTLQLARTEVSSQKIPPAQSVTILSGNDIVAPKKNFLKRTLASAKDSLSIGDKPLIRVFVGDKKTTGREDLSSPIFGETLDLPQNAATVKFVVKIDDEEIGSGEIAPPAKGNSDTVKLMRDGKQVGTLSVSFSSGGSIPKTLQEFLKEFWPAEAAAIGAAPKLAGVAKIRQVLKDAKASIQKRFNILDNRAGAAVDSTRFREILKAVYTSQDQFFVDCQKIAFVLKSMKAMVQISNEQRVARAQAKIKITRLLTKVIGMGTNAIPHFGGVASAITNFIGEMVENVFVNQNNPQANQNAVAGIVADILSAFIFPVADAFQGSKKVAVGSMHRFATGAQCNAQVKFMLRFIYGMLEDTPKVAGEDTSAVGAGLKTCLPDNASGGLQINILLSYLKTFINIPDTVSPSVHGEMMDAAAADKMKIVDAVKDNDLVKSAGSAIASKIGI